MELQRIAYEAEEKRRADKAAAKAAKAEEQKLKNEDYGKLIEARKERNKKAIQ